MSCLTQKVHIVIHLLVFWLVGIHELFNPYNHLLSIVFLFWLVGIHELFNP